MTEEPTNEPPPEDDDTGDEPASSDTGTTDSGSEPTVQETTAEDPSCDPYAGLVESSEFEGCELVVTVNAGWMEAGAFVLVLLLVGLGALVVGQLARGR